jgi:hypothetical protein
MAGPPQDVAPSLLWLHLTSIPRPFEIVDFPRKDPVTGNAVGELAIWVLSQEEQMLAAAEAERYARKLLKNEQPKGDEARSGYDTIYNNEAAVQVLFRACRQKEDPTRPLFPAVEAMRAHLSADEVGALMAHYFTAQSKLGPIIATMTEAEVDAWIERLEKGGSEFPLDLLTSDAKNLLIRSLAHRVASFSTDTTSPGSPQDVPMSEDSSTAESASETAVQ